MKLICIIILPLMVCAAVGCQDPSAQISVQAENQQPVSKSSDVPTASTEREADESGYWDRITTLYENAKASGETSAASAGDWISELYDAAKSSGGTAAGDTSVWARGLYEQARDAGETSAGNAKDWVMNDVQQIGRWQYKTLEIRKTDDVVAQLNKLGAERWECFWVDQQDETITFYLKKTGRSYLRHLPSKDLIRLLPMLGGDRSTPD